MPGSNIRKVTANARDIEKTALELCGKPYLDNLAVFIQDPVNKGQYWFRLLHIFEDNGTVYENLPMGEFNWHPCPEEHLQIAVRNMKEYQEMAGQSPDVQAQKAVVGVSKYNGNRKVRFQDVVSFTAAKYQASKKVSLSSSP